MNDDRTPGNPSPGSSSPSRDPLPDTLQDLIQHLEASSAALPAHTSGQGGVGPCPEPGEWAVLLDAHPRLAGFDKVSALLAHASACRPCAQRLRTLAADPTPEEAATIASLACASPEGQRKISAELARTPRPGSRSSVHLYLWSGGALAASLLIAVGLSVWWRAANNPGRLIAEAYSHDRIFELRIPGADFAGVTPNRHLRGSSSDREPTRLLEARARLESRLEAAPEDRSLLQLEARSQILEEKFDSAIDILDRLVATGSATSSLYLDDATAYFQRGLATGSENDRATALDYFRRADELAPSDTVVLFNEAIAMEDRGQLMNAVETWNRYLRFEHDDKWKAEGQRRLAVLEQKLNELKTHRGRMEQQLSTPQAMLALAADPVQLASTGEELSTTLLPRLINSAFPEQPIPPDAPASAARASPCLEKCQSARILLAALAASLQTRHQDSWLNSLLPSGSSPEHPQLFQAVHALAAAIDSSAHGDYLQAADRASQATGLFHALRNQPGELRARIEQADALQSTANYAGCFAIAHPLLTGNAGFPWIEAHAEALTAYCDPTPGSDVENIPAFIHAQSLAHDHGYALAELRIRNMRGGAAIDSGDVESAWHDYLANLRQFYAGDYPALRLSGTLSGLEQVEQSTPRSRLALLLQREAVATLELTENRRLLATARLNLAAAAVRADSIDEARAAMETAQNELAANDLGKSVESILAEVETTLANVYLERGEPGDAAKLLDAAYTHMAGERNAVYLRNYAVARGQLALEQGHPEAAEPLLRDAILEQERLAGSGGPAAIVHAQQNRDLYAVLTGVWLAQSGSAQSHTSAQALALWERYRLRILGLPVAACPVKALDCLDRKLAGALERPGLDTLIGQIVLPDRLLLYRASPQGVTWVQVPARRQDVVADAERLERAVSSPQTSIDDVHRAARQIGRLLIDPIRTPGQPPSATANLALEPDPLLGNLPWPSVAAADGDLGLETSLEESPSLLLDPKSDFSRHATGNALVVGASIAAGQGQLLPEALEEANAVARFGRNPTLLVGAKATASQILAHLDTASSIHFAGHAASSHDGTRLLLAASENSDSPWLDDRMLRSHPPRAARLIVFSACSSGKKGAAWNHGMGDMVATLASLGVPEVVATRWQIDSSAAVPMMDAFYTRLATGQTVPQALTIARQTLAADPRYRHPYYWAAWYASGTGASDLSAIFHAGS